MADSKLSDEAGRIAALERYCVLDTPEEASFDKITTLVRAVIGAPICAVSLVDRDRQWFKSIQGVDARQTPRNVAFCAHTILTREPLIVPDATADPRFADSSLVTGPPFIRAYAGVPLKSPDGYNLGALCVKDTRPRDFTSDQIDILRHFGALVVDELELRTIAQQDGLTGALTRRAFIEDVGRELQRLRSYQRPAALVMFDVDHFKVINDTYGHPVGDDVLRAVAERCRATLRNNDLFGRIGGEEFALLLPDASPQEARQCAERLRRSFESAPVGEHGIRFTSSFGISPAAAATDSVEHWLAEADIALYAAKRTGRNRVVVTNDLIEAAA